MASSVTQVAGTTTAASTSVPLQFPALQDTAFQPSRIQDSQAQNIDANPAETKPTVPVTPYLLGRPPVSAPYSTTVVPFSSVVVLQVHYQPTGEVLYRIPSGYTARVAPVRHVFIQA